MHHADERSCVGTRRLRPWWLMSSRQRSWGRGRAQLETLCRGSDGPSPRHRDSDAASLSAIREWRVGPRRRRGCGSLWRPRAEHPVSAGSEGQHPACQHRRCRPEWHTPAARDPRGACWASCPPQSGAGLRPPRALSLTTANGPQVHARPLLHWLLATPPVRRGLVKPSLPQRARVKHISAETTSVRAQCGTVNTRKPSLPHAPLE